MSEIIVLEEKVGGMALRPDQSKTLLDSFGDLFVEAHKLVTKGKVIKVTSEDQVEEMKAAKEIRLALVRVRKEAEKAKTEIKEPYLRGAQAAQDIFNDIKKITSPEEDRLKEQEKFAELAQEKRDNERHTKRIEELSKYVDDVSVYSLRDMPEEVYANLVSDCKIAYEAKIARAEQERKEAEEAERVAKLTSARKEKLVDVWSYLTPKQKTLEFGLLGDSDFEKILAKAKESKKVYEDAQEQIRKENEKLAEAKRKADEEKAEAERKLREREEAEAKAAAEAKAKKEAEEKAAAEAKLKALQAPDKEKLLKLADDYEAVVMPALQSDKAVEIQSNVRESIAKVVNFLRTESQKL